MARVALLWVVAFEVALGLASDGPRLAYLALVWLLVSRRPWLLVRALVVTPFLLAALPLLWTAGGPFWGWVSLPGLQRFGFIAARAWLGLAATLWLLDWLGRARLLQALHGLGVPRLLTAILALTLRYSEILWEELQRMLVARSSRSAGPPPPWHWRAQATGALAGNLLVRSQARGERVYAAMLSRGYDGTPLPVGPDPLGWRALLALGLGLLCLCSF